MPSLVDRCEYGAPSGACYLLRRHAPPPAAPRRPRLGSGTAAYGRVHKGEAPRLGRSPQVWMTPMGARRSAARTARAARGADGPRRRAIRRCRIPRRARGGRWGVRGFFSPPFRMSCGLGCSSRHTKARRALKHDASPSSFLSLCRYTASGTTFSFLVYGMPQSVRASSKSVMKQSLAWLFTVSATSASE